MRSHGVRDTVKKNFRKIPKGHEQWCCHGVLRHEVDAVTVVALETARWKIFGARGELMLGPNNPYGLALCTW